MSASAWQQDDTFRKGTKKKQRDLYLEMKRLENPNYGFLRIQDLRAGQHTGPKMKKEKPTKREYHCTTQQNEALDELFLGQFPGKLVLWESGSVINWVARADGYPTDQQAVDAALAVDNAATQWNEVMDGRVRFQYVTNFDDAAFQVVYGGDRPGFLAHSFWPDDWEKSLNTLNIYKMQFEPTYKPVFVNTMLHELGHVLGLRHENAQEDEDVVGWIESILYGPRNPRSVMSQNLGRTIQDSDISSIRRAYDELDDGKVITGQGKLGTVKKTVHRVDPNN